MIALSHGEAETVIKVKAAIAAMNALVIHVAVGDKPPGAEHLPATAIKRIVEADFLLNTAEDTIINDDPDMLEVNLA